MNTKVESNARVVESNEYPGYYHIPGYETYVINCDADVINTKTGNHINPYKHIINGYYVFPFKTKDGKSRHLYRSRALCLVFKPHPLSSQLTIDHINCDKTDDRLENLEWVTIQENTRRAGANGLMGHDVAVEVRDWDTKEVTKYPTLASAARAIGITINAIEYRLALNDGRVFPERKQYRYPNSNTEWRDDITEEDIKELTLMYGNKKGVLIRNLETGEIKKYPLMTLAAKDIGIPLSTMSVYFNRSSNHQPVLPGLYQLKIESDPSDWIDPEDPWLELAKTGRQPIQTINTKTGEVKIYKSQAACARDRGILTTTLNYRLDYPNTVVWKDGYRYGFYPFESNMTKEKSSTTSA